jgi:hypothetical protein
MAGPASSDPKRGMMLYESIRLAFLVALQVLPPRQRRLDLRDVLNWSMSGSPTAWVRPYPRLPA